jgi:hypothetical protein
VGVTISVSAVTVDASGQVTRLVSPGATYAAGDRRLLELLEPVDTRLNRRSPLRTSFPWFFRGAGPNDPSPVEGGHRPKAVLESLQLLERELQRNSQKYPSACKFWLECDGSREAHQSLEVWYRDRPCRLFCDAQGVWAVETSTGPREGIHHDLKDMTQVTVRLTQGGPEASVVIERISFLSQWTETISALKRVCIIAMQANGWVIVEGG